MHHLLALCAALLLLCITPSLQAQERPGLAVAIAVHHVAADTWRIDYRFSQPVTAIKFDVLDDYRQRSWKLLTPGLRLATHADTDLISAGGKPFRHARAEITTFDGVPQKGYEPFNRFSDGGRTFFLGHLQGDALIGEQAFVMSADIRLKGLPNENVVAPNLHKQIPGGPRGYAYFGPAKAVRAGTARFIIDPKTPSWANDTIVAAGARTALYYEQAYQRKLQDELVVMVSMAGFDTPGISIKGGAVMGQLSYRLDGKQMLGDHPKKRELLARMVAHEMAHLWQMEIKRGGIQENAAWIHEGGAEAMALDAVLQTGIMSKDSVAAYRAEKHAACARLGYAVDAYDGIYACGLYRFDQLGVDIVPLWRTMIETTEAKGELYSQQMIDTIAASQRATPAASRPGGASQ